MPRYGCACASEVYGRVFVHISVCVCRLLQPVADPEGVLWVQLNPPLRDISEWEAETTTRSRHYSYN